MEGLLTSREYALLAASAADAKKGSDIIIQDVSELLQITDYFVVVTGQNARQVDSIHDAVEGVTEFTLHAGVLSYENAASAICMPVLPYADRKSTRLNSSHSV